MKFVKVRFNLVLILCFMMLFVFSMNQASFIKADVCMISCSIGDDCASAKGCSIVGINLNCSSGGCKVICTGDVWQSIPGNYVKATYEADCGTGGGDGGGIQDPTDPL